MAIDMTAVYDGARLRFSNPITVTLSRPTSPKGGATVSITVANVQEQPADEAEVASPLGGSLGGVTKVFRMWLVECLMLPPHRGYEVIMADNTVWAVQKVDRLMKGRAFRVHCMQRRNPA